MSGNPSVFSGVTRYHWRVVIIAALAWTFDCMVTRFFVLGRESALGDLLRDALDDPGMVKTHIGYATTSMMLGWATGGIVFGMMSDRLGRVKTMAITLVLYSLFTGLSGLAVSWVDFTIYRFICGLGMGGMFGAATILVAETTPGGFRPLALGALQFIAAFGNMSGSLISLWIQPGAEESLFGLPGWRVLFFAGFLPIALVFPIVFFLKEPDAWLAMRDSSRHDSGGNVGSPLQLFTDRRWRRNSIVGLLLGLCGMIGLWGIGFFSPELISNALQGEAQSRIDEVRAFGTAAQDLGAFFGMLSTMISFRTAAILMATIYLLGAIVLIWAPETKGKPLPDDEATA